MGDEDVLFVVELSADGAIIAHSTVSFPRASLSVYTSYVDPAGPGERSSHRGPPESWLSGKLTVMYLSRLRFVLEGSRDEHQYDVTAHDMFLIPKIEPVELIFETY